MEIREILPIAVHRQAMHVLGNQEPALPGGRVRERRRSMSNARRDSFIEAFTSSGLGMRIFGGYRTHGETRRVDRSPAPAAAEEGAVSDRRGRGNGADEPGLHAPKPVVIAIAMADDSLFFRGRL
jgi:hypothetical protein